MSRTRIVEGTTQITTKGEHSIYSEGNINIVSQQKVSIQGADGIQYGNSPEEAPDIKPGIEESCVVYFRPPSKYSGGFGFDWMKIGERGDIKYQNICGSYKSQAGGQPDKFEKDDAKFRLLGQEYAPLTIRSTEGKGIEKYYTPWVTLYPENTCSTAQSVINLTLDIRAKEKLTKPVKFVCDNPDLFEFTEQVPPTNDKKKELKDTFTLKCKQGFDKVQEIRAVIESDTLKDSKGNPKQILVGRFFILPNDADHRYSVKIQLIKVILEDRDIRYMRDNIEIKINDIKTWLQNKLLPILIEPTTIADIDEVDLRVEYRNGDFDANLIDNKNTATFGNDKKVLSSSGTNNLYDTVHRKYTNQKNDKAKQEKTDRINKERMDRNEPPLAIDAYIEYDDPLENTIFLYFVNMASAQTDTDTTNSGKTLGIANTPGTSVFIFKDGITEDTIVHELLHSLSLKHPFENGSKHVFEKTKTDNIMDYTKDGRFTYKWQWDDVWINQANTLKKESEIREG